MASMDIKRYLRDLVDKLKTEILNQVKQDMSRVIKEMLSGNISQDVTDRRREEKKKRRETFNKEYKENIEYMKQIQRDYQEIKNSIESWQNSLKETKDRLSKLEDKFAMCDHERKDLLKITRKQAVTIQRLEDDKRIYNLRIRNVNKEAGIHTGCIHTKAIHGNN